MSKNTRAAPEGSVIHKKNKPFCCLEVIDGKIGWTTPSVAFKRSENNFSPVDRSGAGSLHAATTLSEGSTSAECVSRLAKPIQRSTHSIKARCRSLSCWIHNCASGKFAASLGPMDPSRTSHGIPAPASSRLTRSTSNRSLEKKTIFISLLSWRLCSANCGDAIRANSGKRPRVSPGKMYLRVP